MGTTNFTKELVNRIAPFMRTNGFSRKGRHFCKITNDLALCFSIEMPSALVYVEAYIVPLYIPCEHRYFTYGNRMNQIDSIKLPVLSKSADADSIENWCQLFCDSVSSNMLPFFQKVDSPHKLLDYMNSSHFSSTSYIFCPIAEICRLKMFTYFYASELEMARNAVIQYCDVLEEMPFTENILQMRKSEAIEILQLLDCEESAATYRANAVANTLKLLK